MVIRELLTRWGIQVDDKALAVMDRKIDLVKRRFDEAGNRSIAFGKHLSLFVTAPLLAAGAAMLKTAADAQEIEERFHGVFSSIQPMAQQTAKTIADSFGVSTVTAQEYLSKSGQILQSMRFSESQALDLGKEITKLSLDIGAFSNVEGGAETVLRAVNGAMAGNVGMLRKTIGTVIEDTEVQAEANRLRLTGIQGTEAQVKALATLRLIQQKNSKAAGAFIKNQDGLEGMLRATHEVIKDVAKDFGELMLPAALAVLKAFRWVLRVVRDLPGPFKGLLIVVGGIAAAIGPALIAFGYMSKSLILIQGGIKTLLPMLGGLKAATLATAGVWALAMLAVFLIFEDIYRFMTGDKSVSRVLVEELGAAIDFVADKFQALPNVVKIAMATFLAPIRMAVNAMQALMGALGAITQGDFRLAGGAMLDQLKQTILPDMGDFGSMLGLSSGERIRPPAPTPGMAAAASGGAGTNVGGVTVQNQINVPPGTPPALVGGAIEKGVKTSLDGAWRQAFETMKPTVEF